MNNYQLEQQQLSDTFYHQRYFQQTYPEGSVCHKQTMLLWEQILHDEDS